MKESEADRLSELLTRTAWVRAVARAIVKDVHRADDLAQDAWVRALEGGPRRAESWKGWFATVMRNRANEERRTAARRVLRDGAHKPANAQLTPLEVQQRMELHQALGAAVCRLTEPYRSTVIRHYFEGWSLRKIAAAEGCGVRAVETRLRRARAMLRDELEKRAPAEHWAGGLLLFAGTQSVLPLAAAAAVLLAVGVSVPLLLRGQQATAPASVTSAAPALITALPAAAPTPVTDLESTAPHEIVTRELVPGSTDAARIELVAKTVDSETKELVPVVKLTILSRDELGRLLETQEGTTDEFGVLNIQIHDATRETEVQALPTGGTRIASGVQQYYWQDFRQDPRSRREILIPVNTLHGVIRGVVRDDAGWPVPGAHVDVWNRDMGNIVSAADRTVLADGNGYFELSPARSRESGVVLAPRASGMTATRVFHVEDNADPLAAYDDVELVMTAGRPFRVLVVDDRGRPVVGASVSIWPGHDSFKQQGEGFSYQGRLSYYLPTDTDGYTPKVMVDSVTWQVAVRHPAYREDPTQLAESGELMVVTIHPGRHLRGRVQTEDGRGVPRVPLIVESASERVEGSSEEDGSFVIRAPGEIGEEVRLICIPSRTFAFQVLGPMVPERLDEQLAITLATGISLIVDFVYSDGRPYDHTKGLRWEVVGGPRARQPGGHEADAQGWLEVRHATRDSRGTGPGGFRGSSFYMTLCPPAEYRIRFHAPNGRIGEAILTPEIPRARMVIDL